MFEKIFPKIHNEGYKFIVIFVFATIVLYFIHGFLGFVGLVLSIWCYYFFRDPERVSIGDEDYLTSPADGVVLQVFETNGPKELGLEDRKFTKVSIFMNVFDCHVNRIPCSGKITEILYKPGKFINASLDKASEDNERNYHQKRLHFLALHQMFRNINHILRFMKRELLYIYGVLYFLITILRRKILIRNIL